MILKLVRNLENSRYYFIDGDLEAEESLEGLEIGVEDKNLEFIMDVGDYKYYNLVGINNTKYGDRIWSLFGQHDIPVFLKQKR